MGGAGRDVRVTFHGLTYTEDPMRGGSASGAAVPSNTDDANRFERDTLEIVKRLSRRPTEAQPESELMADLGFDSLQVLELVGELEDHFNIAVPLNGLTHVRTVAQIAAEVARIVNLRGTTA
jgi:acyl carrier protein